MMPPQRPIGALCLRCGVTPARANVRHPHLATSWCVSCQRHKTSTGPKRKQRPLGALCLHGCGRPARANKNHPHLATSYCSDHCAAKDEWDLRRAERLTLSNDIRIMLNMDVRNNTQFSLPELRRLHERVRRLLPLGVRVMRDEAALHAALPHAGRAKERRAS